MTGSPAARETTDLALPSPLAPASFPVAISTPRATTVRYARRNRVRLCIGFVKPKIIRGASDRGQSAINETNPVRTNLPIRNLGKRSRRLRVPPGGAQGMAHVG